MKGGLVLIKGSGAVRAGVWARSAAVNDNLEMGSMLPQVKWARDQGMPVLIMNPIAIQKTNSFDSHCTTVWKDYVENSGITGLNLIAHSRGGGGLSCIMKSFPKTFYKQVSKVALTDSGYFNIKGTDLDRV